MLCCKHERLCIEELRVVEQVMNTYLEERWSSVGLSFNPWEHSRAEQQGILLAIFKNLHVLTVLELTPSEMLDFCLDIEKLYKDVPYHSFNHAVDVVVKLYYVLHDLQASSYLASYDIAVLLISGLCHDAGHPGLNNLFQKNANTECAQKYPDAILERYSIDLAVEHVGKHRLFRNVENVRDPLYNDSTTTEPDVASRMMSSIRSAILYTDMSRHFDVLEECKVLVSALSKKARRISDNNSPSSEYHSDNPTHGESHELSQVRRQQQHSLIPPSPPKRTPPRPKLLKIQKQLSRGRSPSEPPTPAAPFISALKSTNITIPSQVAPLAPLQTPPSATANSSSNEAIGRGSGSGSNIKRIHMRRSISMCDALLDSTQRQSLIGILLHAVDVFNPVLPWPMCKKWSDLMNTESFNQGDLEKKLSLPVSPNMDRETTDQRQVSLDFGNIIIRPFFLELVSLFPVEDALLPSLDRNLVKWSRLSSDSTSEVSAPVGANSRMYSWPTEPKQTPVSRTSSRILAEGRRLSVAAGTVDIPQSRLEMIRRHSHEGFEALHRRMVGRLFSKHLEKIQERRKVSYTASQLPLARRDGQHHLPAANINIPISGPPWRGFDTDLLSPVTETSGAEDISAPASGNDSGAENQATAVASELGAVQLPTPQQHHHPAATPLGNPASGSGSATHQPAPFWASGESDLIGPTPTTSTDGLPVMSSVGMSIHNCDAMPSYLSSYRIDKIAANGRQHRSTSLDPSILSNLPSSYPSLHRTRPEKISSGLSDER